MADIGKSRDAASAVRLPDRLYHGTHAGHLTGILLRGLLPRSASGMAVNYSEYPSHPDRVYLTRHPFSYASIAARAHSAKAWLIVEIDTTFIDKAKLVADDDAAIVGKGFASMSGNDDVRKSAHLRANDCDAFNYFDKYGHIAYLGAVHSEAITQIMIVDVDSFGGDVDLSEDVQSGADISYLEGALDFEAWLVRIFFHRDRSALQSPFCREHPEYCNYIRRGRLQGVRVIGLKKSGRRLSHARRVSRMAEESDA